MSARELLEQARRAHDRIPELVAVIAEGGFDWRPDTAGGGIGDPTSSMAIASMELLARERAELAGLEAIVGEALRLIAGVRAGLGDAYADVLELYYVDALPWVEVADECRCSRPTAVMRRDVAIEWADSVGDARAAAGEGFAT